MVFVHGGAWVRGDKAQYKPGALKLSENALCVAVIQYGLAPATQHPAPVEQLHEALKKIISEKSSFCDSQRIFLIGHSAGAHMIAFWNSKYQIPEVKGFIGLAGIYDLSALSKLYPSYDNWFLKKAFGEKDSWKLASPINSAPKSKAPWLLLHSKDDELVNVEQSLDFQKHLKKEKVPVALVVLKNVSHFQVVEGLRNKQNLATKEILNFIQDTK